MRYLLLLLSLCLMAKVEGQECIVECIRGTYCSGDRCPECPKGEYSDRDDMRETSCKKWTRRPSGEGWILTQNGSRTQDQMWGCDHANGYTDDTRTEQGTVKSCKPPVSTPSVPPTTTAEQNVTMTVSLAPSGGLSVGKICAIVIPVVVIVIAVVIYFILDCCYFSKKCQRISLVYRWREKKKQIQSTDDGERESTTPEELFLLTSENRVMAKPDERSAINESNNGANGNNDSGSENSKPEVIIENETEGRVETEVKCDESFETDGLLSKCEVTGDKSENRENQNESRHFYKHLLQIMKHKLNNRELKNFLENCGFQFLSLSVKDEGFPEAFFNWAEENADKIFSLFDQQSRSYPFFTDSRELRKLKGLPEDPYVTGEFRDVAKSSQLFTFLSDRVSPGKLFLMSLKTNEEIAFNMNTQIDNKNQARDREDFFECGKEWVRWHLRWDHEGCIKEALKILDCNKIIDDPHFQDLIRLATGNDTNAAVVCGPAKDNTGGVQETQERDDVQTVEVEDSDDSSLSIQIPTPQTERRETPHVGSIGREESFC